MNILAKLGLMKVSEHDRRRKMSVERLENVIDSKDETIGRIRDERDDWKAKHASVVDKLAATEAKYKAAITDLAAARDEVERLTKINADHCRSVNSLNLDGARLDDTIRSLELELATLRPIAEKAIAKAARDAAAKRDARRDKNAKAVRLVGAKPPAQAMNWDHIDPAAVRGSMSKAIAAERVKRGAK